MEIGCLDDFATSNTIMFYTWAILIGLLPASHGIQDAIRVTHDVIASPSWKTRGNCARSWSFVHGYWQTNLPFDDAYDQNCLLKTDWSNAEHVDNIFIQVTSVTRKCSSFLAKYPNCVENVSVLINTKGRKGYRILSKIPKAVDFDNDSTLSTSVSTLELGAITTDFRLGFTAKRTSLSIQKLKIFYYKCPTRTKELTQFKETSAPGSSKHVTTITGECVTNAQVIAGTITLSCYHNGTYQTNGECVCNAGYFRNSTVCQACPTGAFKPRHGNENCRLCGKNTVTEREGNTQCSCKEGHFFLGAHEVHCYAAGKVRRLIYSNYTDGSVVVHWDPAYRRPGYKPTYIVSFNNVNYRTTQRVLRFTPSNATRSFKIQIVTEVNVRGKVYRSNPLLQTVTVHKYRYKNLCIKLKTSYSVIMAVAAVLVILGN